MDVKFDCKVATVTMKPDATLDSAAAEKALVGVGLGMTQFLGGSPPSSAVIRALVRFDEKAKPEGKPDAKLAATLARELPSVQEAFLESDGRLTLLLKADAKLADSELAAALAKHFATASAFESRAWPKSRAGCIATVRAKDAATRATARGAIEKVDVVLAAIEAAPAEGSGEVEFVVFTKEPCSNLEARLREALRPAGSELVKVVSRP